MNETVTNQFRKLLDDLDWLQATDLSELPPPLPQFIPSLKQITIPLRKATRSALGNNLSDEVVKPLSNYYRLAHPVLDRLKEQAAGKPTIAVNNLSSELQNVISNLSQIAKPNNELPLAALAGYFQSFDPEDAADSELSNQVKQATALNQQVEETLRILRRQSAEFGIERFAAIFGAQAISHSRFWMQAPNEKHWMNRLKIGAAELWLFVGTLLLILPTYYFLNAPLPTSSTLMDIVPFIARKLLILSIWFFSVRFAFRNYTHHKYFSVQNLHRQNVLNSFRLLVETLPADDTSARTALMQEVAKNIYIGGKNPFLVDNKKNDMDISGAIELVKLFRS